MENATTINLKKDFLKHNDIEDAFRTNCTKVTFSNNNSVGLLVNNYTVHKTDDRQYDIVFNLLLNPTSINFANDKNHFVVTLDFYETAYSQKISTMTFCNCSVKEYSFTMDSNENSTTAMICIVVHTFSDPLV